MNENGKWYLTYVEYDDMENNIVDAIKLKKVPLSSVDRDRAEKEARSLWEQRLNEGCYLGWFDKKTYPRSPSLMFEASIEQE